MIVLAIVGIIVVLRRFEIRVRDGRARFGDKFVDTSVAGEAVGGGGSDVLRDGGGESDGVSDRHNENYVKIQ